MRTPLSNKSSVLLACGFLASIAMANFTPILLTDDSYNHDVVIETTAPTPLVPVTTASMDGGLTNAGFAWFERGHNTVWPATGLPEAGSILVSDSSPDHQYAFAPTYQGNNVILIDSRCAEGSFRLTRPAAYSSLSVLTSSGGGGSMVIGYRVHLQDGSTETGSFTCPDWIGGSSPAWRANGRINVSAFTYDIINSDNPRLYTRDIRLSNSTSPVLSVEFNYLAGFGHNAIFALSGADFSGTEFIPINVTGYNQDMVVEAGAIKPGWLDPFTTATMDNGTDNARRTWYETGYYPPATNTGLPAAGSILTSAGWPAHVYAMAPSYTNNNAILLDAAVPSQLITFSNRARYAVLSFLTASGHGPVTNVCVINHADGVSQTNLFVSPDWFDSAPAAFTANGCVSISSKVVTCVNAGFPKLFAVDLALTHTNSPVIGLSLAFKGGGNDSHAIVFAVSGSTELPPPSTAPRLSIDLEPNGTVSIISSAAGKLQSTSALRGLETIWQDEGPVAQNTASKHIAASQVKFFRVVAP